MLAPVGPAVPDAPDPAAPDSEQPLDAAGPPGGTPSRGGPLRECRAVLGRRRRPVALLALAAAGTAAGLALLVPPPVTAGTSVQVGSVGTADPGPATARALAAATSAAFTDRVAELSGSTPDEVADRLTVSSPAPGVVDVRAGAGSADPTGTALAADAVTTLGERLGALDAAVTAAGTDPLWAELGNRAAGDPPSEGSTNDGTSGTGGGSANGTAGDPLADELGRALADRTGLVTVVVPGPEPVAERTVPLGWWVAGAAGLAGLAVPLLVATCVPALRRSRRLLPEAGPAAAITAHTGLPVVEPGWAPNAVPLLADTYRARLRDLPTITVVQLTPEPACDVAGELVKAAVLVGDRPAYRDLTPGAPPAGEVTGEPVVRALRVPRLAHEDLRLLRDGGPTVLAVQTAGTTARDVATVAAALRAVGADPVLCLVWPGRMPRDPARVPLPTDARIGPAAS
ncbi:hypothetical protein ACLFMI_00665 [Pseudonocardia nantongensis]|uniref:hypothetical protein n=1 Tax=Pseudonocardia nantongensis TaxID=1181885 RepID=UPI00397E8AC4